MSVGVLLQERHGRLRGGRQTLLDSLSAPTVAALAAVTALAAALRFAGLAHQGFWFDEGNTALLVHFSPGKMVGLIPQTESTPPLYYCLAWVWARVFGYGEAGLRSLSALAGVLTVPIAYATAHKLLGSRVALITAALTACSPLLIWYSQEARSYSLLVLLTAVALLAAAHARATPTPRLLAAWVIASGLALATHYYAVLAIVPQAAWLLAAHRRRRAVQLAVGIVAACGLALIPLAITQTNIGRTYWIGHTSLSLRLGQIIPQFVIGTGAPAYGVLEPLAAATAALGLLLLVFRARGADRRMGLSLAALAAGGLVLNLLLVAVGIDDLITRNILAIWLPAAIAVAAGLGSARAGALGLLACGLLCATGIVATVRVATDRQLQRPDWRPVARALGQSAPAQRVILIQHYRDRLPLSLYMPRLGFWRDEHGRRAREVDVIAIAGAPGQFCWWGSACNLSPSQMQRSYPLPGFHRLWLRHVNQFSIMRLVSDRPVVLTRADFARALTTTTISRDGLFLQR